jgi:transposase
MTGKIWQGISKRPKEEPDMKKHRVKLPLSEQRTLKEFIHKGVGAARKLTRARVLLKAHEGWKDAAIAEALEVSERTVGRIRERYASGGLENVLEDRIRPGVRPKLDGKQEAFLVALACSDPPEGRVSWTMQLLADRLVELKVVESISDETVRLRLKKTTSNPGKNNTGASRK